MKHLQSFVLWTTLVSLSSMSAYATHAQQANSSTEEHAVYLAVLGEMFGSAKDTLLVISEDTVKNHFAESEEWKQVREQLPTLSEQTVEDYKPKNKDSHKVKALDIKTKHVFLGKKDFDQIFKEGPKGWEEFYKRYPDSGGYIGFSRVGFNMEMDQALVYVEHGCGGLCGTGHYVLLKKDGGAWKIVKKHMAWIS